MQAFIKDLFNFKGRANRAKYISTMFYLLALYFVLGFLALVIVSFSSYEKGAVTVVLEAIMTTMFFICIASLVAASLCNSIRRCHDLNLPGWVAFIFFLAVLHQVYFSQLHLHLLLLFAFHCYICSLQKEQKAQMNMEKIPYKKNKPSTTYPTLGIHSFQMNLRPLRISC